MKGVIGSVNCKIGLAFGAAANDQPNTWVFEHAPTEVLPRRTRWDDACGK